MVSKPAISDAMEAFRFRSQADLGQTRLTSAYLSMWKTGWAVYAPTNRITRCYRQRKKNPSVAMIQQRKRVRSS
ncbi:hypothetical protein NQZ68_009073 [Dissostichus eleginoides]|nr:hypothetical protein NQZ68_009073 [Dissostichus eleginoides]